MEISMINDRVPKCPESKSCALFKSSGCLICYKYYKACPCRECILRPCCREQCQPRKDSYNDSVARHGRINVVRHRRRNHAM